MLPEPPLVGLRSPARISFPPPPPPPTRKFTTRAMINDQSGFAKREQNSYFYMKHDLAFAFLRET